MTTRTFQDIPAVRTAVPLLVGLSGPSGCGKTFSALRLATGMQKIGGGEIFVIDTEARRALHYADNFNFRHVEFKAPFGPLDYLAAIEHCVSRGAKIIIVDSMSHEHEGPGGVLEMHAAAVERMSGGDENKAKRVTMLAWVKPKQERRRLLNSLVQTGASMIFCFRAKEKIKPVAGRDPIQLGWMPIAGDEFVYEMTTSVLLPAAARGVPDWQPEQVGERMMVKLPAQFGWLAESRGPLDEAAGERMGLWAAGNKTNDEDLVAAIRNATTKADLEALAPRLRTGRDLAMLRAAYGDKLKVLNAPPVTVTGTLPPDAMSPPREREPGEDDEDYVDDGPPDGGEPGGDSAR
jgi:ABC-type dipeptide/oligopeptide/nickel transport system ATPase subunit